MSEISSDCSHISHEIVVELNECKAFELSQKVSGIGVKLSNRIINERNKNGNFKDWNDVKQRVYGIGDKMIEKMKNANVNIQFKKHGFTIEYVDLGPETQPFPETLPPEFKNLRFLMQKNGSKNIDTS